MTDLGRVVTMFEFKVDRSVERKRHGSLIQNMIQVPKGVEYSCPHGMRSA